MKTSAADPFIKFVFDTFAGMGFFNVSGGFLRDCWLDKSLVTSESRAKNYRYFLSFILFVLTQHKGLTKEISMISDYYFVVYCMKN